MKTLSSSSGIRLSSIASARVVYLALDSSRDESPFVVGADGKPLKPNPLKDVRVRQALSKLINRQLIVDRILDGAGEAAGQIVPAGIGGADPSLKATAADVAGAKKLLADAGFPQAFGLTIHTSNDRFAGDAETRAGDRADVRARRPQGERRRGPALQRLRVGGGQADVQRLHLLARQHHADVGDGPAQPADDA